MSGIPDVPKVLTVNWVYHPDTATITAEVQGDGHSVVVTTIPADPPDQ